MQGESVVAASGRRVPHEGVDVVVAQEPCRCLTDEEEPSRIAGGGGGRGSRVGERGDLDRLLIVTQSCVASLPAGGGQDGLPAFNYLNVTQPGKHPQTVTQKHGVAQEVTGAITTSASAALA